MKKIKKILLIIFITLLLLFFICIPITNNLIAARVESKIKDIPLPKDTEIIDSISIAGKLTGNGNGMQYFGAILIKSNLDIIELENYYKSYRKNEWSLNIKKQDTAYIDVIEHGEHSFSTKDIQNNCYIIYSWESNKLDILSLDIRGH